MLVVVAAVGAVGVPIKLADSNGALVESATVILEVPSKDTPLIVLAVVSLAADATLLEESVVLSTLTKPTSALDSVTIPVLPATEDTSPEVILT